MKILYYDCFSGISGDMNLGALVDLGVAPEYLAEELKKLKLDGYKINFSEAQRKGITGTQVDVVLAQGHHHGHEHDEHSHHERSHRNLHDIAHIIRDSELSAPVKKMSLDIFQLVALAESKIHAKPVDEVHFHEVGAIDSIVDIVGAAICIDFLKPDRIIASPVEMGGGFVHCAHGVFPVPAPATLEIMKDKPMKLGATPFETATPTGVAILVALADEFTETPAFTISKTGYGIGHRDTDIPNVLRVCLGETDRKTPENTVDAVILECNIDDMNPEYYTYIIEQLFASGADDVFLQHIVMKKTRPAVLLSVLCSPEKATELEHILFTETSTMGVRYHTVKKKMLARKITTVDTPWGPVRVKAAFYQNQALKSKPEYDDCAAIARQNGLHIEQVYQYIREIFYKKCDD
jgi:uncharacterized protein (TIGR00299 family) protein